MHRLVREIGNFKFEVIALHNALPEQFRQPIKKREKNENCCRSHIKAINMEFNLVNKIIKHSVPHCDISVSSHACKQQTKPHHHSNKISVLLSISSQFYWAKLLLKYV